MMAAKAPAPNGKMAVYTNGHTPETASQFEGRSETKEAKKTKRSCIRWTFGLIVRLCIWYTLLTPFVRCPSRLEDLTESSPVVCKPYLIARTHVDPYVTPYYNQYAAPYVEIARPYAQVFNERIYTPAARVTKQGYDKYGAPTLQRARIYGEEQWRVQAVPRLRAAQDNVHNVYAVNVDPHVQRVLSAVRPHYELASGTLVTVYGDYIIPYYNWSRPYVKRSYASGRQLFETTVVPLAHETWSSVIYFANSSLWPTMTGLYSENVEPQLVKIGQRLASYREGKRLRAAVEDIDSVSEHATSVASPTVEIEPASTSAPTSSSATVEAASATNEVKFAAKATLSPQEQVEQARYKVASDLQTWQEKFAAAADKGAEDLNERVSEIVESLIASSASSHGESLVNALNSTVEHQLSAVKQRINALAQSLPAEEAPEAEGTAQDALLHDIRQAAMSIRERAHALRQWSRSFEEELTRRVSAAVDTTVDILDSIRDLGLQEIGMRWAWMEGVTYKDWAKYHAVKAQFENWRTEVSDVGMKHAKVDEARTLANEILGHGMDVAEAAAKELSRLKDVGKWKISAREVSDNFETRSEPPPPLPKPSSHSDEALNDTESEEDMTLGISDETEAAEPPSSASSSAVSGSESSESIAKTTVPLSSESQTPVDETQAPMTTEDDLSPEQEDSALDADVLTNDEAETIIVPVVPVESEPSTPRKVWGGAAAQAVPNRGPKIENDDDEQAEFSEKLQSVVSQAGDRYAEVTKAVSEALLGPSSTPGVGEQAASIASDQYSRALSAASSVLYGTPMSPGEKISSAASERYSQAVAAASSVIYGTQQAPLESMTNQARTAVSDTVDHARELYEIAKSQVLAQMEQTSLPIHEELLSSIEAAYSRSRDYVTEGFEKAKPAFAYPTPSTTNKLDHISSIASSRLSEGLSVASAQLAQVQATIPPSLKEGHSQILLDARRRYYEAIGLAHDQFSAFVSSASQAVHPTPTPTPLGENLNDLLATAKSHYDAASSKASVALAVALASASSAVNVAQASTTQGMLEAASSRYEAALSAASSSLSLASASASSAIYGTPTGSIESLASQASENWEHLLSKASEQVYGTPTPNMQNVLSYVPHYEAVHDLVSELLVGKEPSFTESVVSKLRAVYETPYPVAALSSASSFISEGYVSASSVAAAHVTDIPSIEGILNAATDQLNSAIDAASVRVYGTPKGTVEQATSAAASAYASASAQISAAIFVEEAGYIERAKGAIEEAFSSADSALRAAMPAVPTEPADSALSAAAAMYSTVTAAAAENISSASVAVESAYSSLQFRASTAVYGEPQGALESASSRLAEAVQSAQARLEDLASSASAFGATAAATATSQVEDITSAAKSVVQSVRDEL